MKKKQLWTAALLLAMGTSGALAQTTVVGDKQLKRITFDRERVTIVYADGTTDDNVETAVVSKSDSETTGVKPKTVAKHSTQRQCYTVDGRAIVGEPRQKGLYIEKSEKGTKKIIKK